MKICYYEKRIVILCYDNMQTMYLEFYMVSF